MSNTLLVFATRWGASAETATIIAAILREKFSFTVDVINLKKTKEAIDLEKYANVIIGSSIAYERWTKEAKAFLANDFSEKKVAVFVCALHYSRRYLENVFE
ncbi:MAG: flavodoxin domain-containing protein, partial [Candidatus Hodarchaeales archaeon]